MGKYNLKENKKVIDYHKSRRMFVVKEGQLIIAEPNLSYSHAVWFEKEGWMNQNDDLFIKTNVRGAVMKDGNIGFYIDWDFQVNKDAERQFMPHLQELVARLDLDVNAQLVGGYIAHKKFQPRQSYGTIADNL